MTLKYHDCCFWIIFNTIVVSNHMYLEDLEGTQVLAQWTWDPTMPGIELTTCSVRSKADTTWPQWRICNTTIYRHTLLKQKQVVNAVIGISFEPVKMSKKCPKKGRHCGLAVSAPAYDRTGCEFESWQCRINIPCSLTLSPWLLGSLWGSLGTYGLTQSK